MSQLERTARASAWRSPATWASVIIAIGVVLRVRQYLANRSLWLDELWLANSILSSGFAELAEPLPNAQTAPVGFLWIVKGLTVAFGSSETVLRLVPLVAGSVLLPLVYIGASPLAGRGVAAMAVALLAFEKRHLNWSLELKPYALDAVVAFALVLLFVRAVKLRFSATATGALVAGGIFALFVSHPAVIILAAGIAGAAVATRDRPSTTWPKLALASAVWAACFSLQYWLLLRDQIGNGGNQEFWRDHFPPAPFEWPSDLAWFPLAVRDIFRSTIKTGLPEISLALFVVGVGALARTQRLGSIFLVAPVLFGLAAASLRQYPFGGRLLTYFAPLAGLGIAVGVGWIGSRTPRWPRLLAAILFVAAMAENTAGAAARCVRPEEKEEARPVLEAVATRSEPGDLYYLAVSSEPAFRYYASRAGLVDVRSSRGSPSPNSFEHELTELAGERRVWIFFAHGMRLRGGIDNERSVLDIADRLGVRLDSVRATGSAAHLYDFRAHSASEAAEKRE